MNPEKPSQEIDFIWRRLTEPLADWAIAVPVLFALGVVLLLALFRTERRWSMLGWHLLIVAAGAAVYIPLALFFKPQVSWWVVLAPMLGIGLLYVGLMYIKDAHTVHPLWAAFLGLLRCTVYAILAVVFLLPGCETFDTNEYHPKVLVLLDVSTSMATVDALPAPGQDPSSLPARRDLVLKFLSDKIGPDQESFLDRVLKKSAFEIHRFGGQVDELKKLRATPGKEIVVGDLAAFLKPDVDQYPVREDVSDEEKIKDKAKILELIDNLTTRTNVPGSALQVTKNEGNSYLQAIIIISDGQTNVGNTQDAINQLHARVNNDKRRVPIFTVGVGEFRVPATIKLEDLQLPDDATPDDKFPVRVPITATGLIDEEIDCLLEVIRFKNASGLEVADKIFVLPAKKVKLEASGDNQKAQAEFEIDLQGLTGVKLPTLKAETPEEKKAEAAALARLEGRYKFTAKVRRHPREAFKDDVHVSKPAGEVQVQRKKLRVLLFASGPGRDYQFIRTLFFREATANRLEFSVFLQQTAKEDNVDQDVKAERLLSEFPKYLGELAKDDAKDKYLNLAEYDVIVSIDPDWSQLKFEQLKMLQEWVGAHSGGIVFVAGPVHSYFLARPAGADITPLQSIYPVTLKDSRLIGTNILHDPARPYPLNFSGYAKEFDFIKLDENGEGPTAGWDQFFWGAFKKPAAGKDVRPLRGIHNYYPVDSIKPGAQVVATFPAAPRIDDGKEEMPFIVAMKYGSGKSVYIGSAETYRLRGFNNSFHERFWIKLARYVSAGMTPQKRYVRLVLAPYASVGTLSFEAQLKGRDLLPLSRDLIPTVEMVRTDGKEEEKKPARFDLRPRNPTGDWDGWFMGTLKLDEPGQYEIRLPIPGVGETLTKKLTVRRPDPEQDNLRTNFAALYQIATDAAPVLDRLTASGPAGAETRKDVERYLSSPAGELIKEDTGKDSGVKLYFSLYNADHIARCLVELKPKKESVKGALEDLWDKGAESGLTVNALLLGLIIPAAIGLLGCALLLVMNQRLFAVLFLGGGLLISLGFGLTHVIAGLSWSDWVDMPVNFSYVMLTCVSLLCVEWLTRKLLKLA